MPFTVIPQPANLRDPGKQGALDDQGHLRILPAEFYRQFSTEELMVFGNRNAIYSIPTMELVDWLQAALTGKFAIEIGAGNGVLAKALAIPATDNWMQTWPEIVAHYNMLRQPLVSYGNHVENIDAADAIAQYKPEVVLACWVTHRYREDRHELGGNMFGVDEEAICKTCQTYIHVGNSATHANKTIRKLPHRRYQFNWLVSRAKQPELNEICVWGEKLPIEP